MINSKIPTPVLLFSLSFLFSLTFASTPVIPIGNKSETVIAFGSCSNYKQEKDPQIFNRVIEQKPDIWVWIGDVAYIWDKEKNETKVLDDFNRAKNAPSYAKLRSQMPVIGIWDDHDYGINNGDKHNKFKDRNRRLYLDFIDEPQDTLRRTRADGIYTSYYLGEDQKIKVIMLDIRYNRDPRFCLSPDADVLGQAQWDWFEEELNNNTAEVTLITSGTQVMVDDRFYPEHWYTYALERLYKTIRESKKSGVIFLSGDVHYAEIMKHPCPARIGYNLYEFTSSGLTHYMSGYNLPYGGELVSAISPYTFNKPEDRYLYRNFGIIRVNKQGGKTVSVALEVHDENGKAALTKVIPYSELTYNAAIIDLKKECVLDSSPFGRIVTAYVSRMLQGDKVLWGFTLIGGFGGIFGLLIAYFGFKFAKKVVSKVAAKLKLD